MHRWTKQLDEIAAGQREAQAVIEEMDERLRLDPNDGEAAALAVLAERRLAGLDATEREVRAIAAREEGRR